jgi:hypothetical protein
MELLPLTNFFGHLFSHLDLDRTTLLEGDILADPIGLGVALVFADLFWNQLDDLLYLIVALTLRPDPALLSLLGDLDAFGAHSVGNVVALFSDNTFTPVGLLTFGAFCHVIIGLIVIKTLVRIDLHPRRTYVLALLHSSRHLLSLGDNFAHWGDCNGFTHLLLHVVAVGVIA